MSLMRTCQNLVTLGRQSKMVPNDTASCSSHLVSASLLECGMVWWLACDRYNMAKVTGCHLHFEEAAQECDVGLADRLSGLLKQMSILETARWKDVRVGLGHSQQGMKALSPAALEELSAASSHLSELSREPQTTPQSWPAL